MVAPKEKRELASDAEQGRYRRAWNESHGTPLMGFAALIFLLGMILIYTTPEASEAPEIDLTGETLSAEAVLLVRVTTDQPESDGAIRIAVYGSEESFRNPDEAIIKEAFIPEQGIVAWPINLTALPERFAVAAFHDVDGNGELTRGSFKIPTEPYGFSNDARGLTGPPDYEDAVMQKPTESTAIEVPVY